MNLFHPNSTSLHPSKHRHRLATPLAVLGGALFLLASTPASTAQENTPSPPENPPTTHPVHEESIDNTAAPTTQPLSPSPEDVVVVDDETADETARAIYEAERTIGFQLPIAILGGLLAGLLFLVYFVPRLADRVASFFYSPQEKVAPKPNWLAVEKIGQGDYEGAIAEYRKLMKKQPDLLFPVTEIANLYLEKLDDPDSAVDFLEQSLKARQWPVADTASLMFRVVDIELEQRGNPTRARELLSAIAENFQGTRHAANAKHKIEEIDAIADTKDAADTEQPEDTMDTKDTKDTKDTAKAKDVGESEDANHVGAKPSSQTP